MTGAFTALRVIREVYRFMLGLRAVLPWAPRRGQELRISKSRRGEEGNMGSKRTSSRGSRANQFKTTVLCDGSGFLVIIGCIVYFHIFEGGKENDCI